MADRDDYEERNPYAAPESDLVSRQPERHFEDGERGHRLIEAGDVLSTSWEIYKKRWGITVGGMLVGYILINLCSVPQNVLQVIGESMDAQGNGDGFLFMILSLCLLPLSIAGQSFFMAGQTLLLFNVARGKHAELSDLFSGGPYFWRMLGCTILYGLMVFFGIVACLIPGLILGLMFYSYSYALIDEDAPGISSLSRARAASKGNLGALFIIGIAMFGVYVLGLLMLCIGAIFTYPLGSLFFAVAYCKMTGQQTGEAME